jgi:hypothetical protein
VLVTAYRATDPLTSRLAAVSVDLSKGQAMVMHAFRMYGPHLTDVELCQITSGVLSPSGARTRRAELVDMGRIRDTGRTVRLRSGRYAIVWELVPAKPDSPAPVEAEQRALWGDR